MIFEKTTIKWKVKIKNRDARDVTIFSIEGILSRFFHLSFNGTKKRPCENKGECKIVEKLRKRRIFKNYYIYII